MRTNVRFRTNKFKRPSDNEDEFAGEELAKWLLEKMPPEFNLDYLDDHYHCLLFVGKPAEKYLEGACGHVDENQWLVYMHVKRSLLSKLLKRPLPYELHKRFIRALDHLIQQEPEFSEVEWFEEDSRHQEINFGSRAF